MHSINFQPDDRVLVTAARDGLMRLFTCETGELISELEIRGTYSIAAGVQSVLFTPDGSQLLVVSDDIPTVEALDPESLELIWSYDGYHSGPNWLRLQLVKPNGRLYCTGSGSAPRILDLATGTAIMEDRPDLREIVASPKEGTVYAVRDGAIEVLDGESLDLRYTLVEFPGDDELAFLPSFYCRSTLEALQQAWIVIDGQARSLESLATVLYDPKRVLAGAAGIPVRPAVLERW